MNKFLFKFALIPLVFLSFTISTFTQTKIAGMPILKKGANYETVRKKMIKSGWKPYTDPNADQCMEGDERCQNRPEMQNCSGTGYAPCRFLWKRKNKYVVIYTIGENAAYESFEAYAPEK